MTKPLSRVKVFDAQLAKLREGIRDLIERKELASLRMIEAPADSELRREMHEIAADLAKKRTEVDTLTHARAGAARLDAVQDRAARLQDLQALCDSALKIACEERPAVAAKIEALIAKLKGPLEEYAELTAACRRDACKLAIEVEGHEAFVLNSHTIVEPANGNTGGVTDALSGALAAAGVGRIGIRIPGLEQFGDPTRANIVDAATLDGTRLAHRLKALVLSAAQEHFAADEKVEAEAERRRHRLGASVPVSALVASPMKKD